MIHKHVILAMGFLAALASFTVQAQPTNPVSTNIVSTNGLAARPRSEEVRKLGDLAPPLTVLEWIKGRPVKIRPGTNIYAIVFCTLSRAGDFALTNLEALQKQYQDKGLVTVIVSEESPEQLHDFMQLKGGEINFTVAADDLAGKTANNYARLFNRHIAPDAYVVGKDGTVLWYGHPLREGMGEVVDEVTSGRYNQEQTKKRVEANQLMDAYLAMAHQGDPRAARVGRIMLRFHTNDAPALCDLAFKIATDPYIEKRDTALANRALDRAEQLATTNVTDIAVDRAILLFQAGDQDEGLAKARQALTTAQTGEEKDVVNATIRAMEARLAKEKTNQLTAVKSGATNAPPSSP